MFGNEEMIDFRCICFFIYEWRVWRDESYLVQEEIPVVTDYRYMGYRTQSGEFYRVAYEKKHLALNLMVRGWCGKSYVFR